ncbi:acyl-CoA dehydrogenase NM domain-like protein [Piedraia hortae CBS 480.64]|uniref:Acyl-CoA dehydrogenase NM domain-like protein n=1 Tax=Piedraia hortae CBS 480.64 TaxID=1314780 RepID=A0A6A7C9T1_9PEZI|nr:acyl-CoA dehydrogenase NM domain-like protein [Piedraia hortae CBS 480.64]
MSLTSFTPTELTVRDGVSPLLTNTFPESYWLARDNDGAYPSSFHRALADGGWLGIALPTALNGSGLGISEATLLLQTISESGAGMSGAQSVHANIYATQPIAKFASERQKSEIIPKIVSGEWRVCFGVTEPGSGLDTLNLKTSATRVGEVRSAEGHVSGGYLVNGTKLWITNAQSATHMLLLARTGKGTRQGSLSFFFVPLPKPSPPTLNISPIPKMGGKCTTSCEVVFTSHPVPETAMIGVEGTGFGSILHGMNAERCLLAGEALGLGYAALNKAVSYARERVVFGRPIGMNQGIQHPLAEAYMNLEAAKLATYHAARLYDRGEASRTEIGGACNSAKFLAAEAAFKACERAVLTLGGMGYAKEFHVERYLRECFVPRIAPVSKEMILNYIGEKTLGLPKSY